MTYKRYFSLSETQRETLLLAMAVRNAIEDVHAKFIPDSAMPELNREVRKAIWTIINADEDDP